MLKLLQSFVLSFALLGSALVAEAARWAAGRLGDAGDAGNAGGPDAA